MITDIQYYARKMPQYQEILDFLQKIMDFQAALDARAADVQLSIEPGTARKKWQAGLPLLTGETLIISFALFQEILEKLRSLLPEAETAQATLDRLLTSNFMAPSHIEALPGDFITDRDGCIRQIAGTTATDPDVVTCIMHAALSPFFILQAAPFQEIVETAAWQHGFCPICGSKPWMARLTYDNGRRVLACSLCYTQWAFDRLRCPFCEGDGHSRLRYFTVDGDNAHRVDCCERCHRYIKTVDERAAGRKVNLQVEDVITAHLDALAEGQGYT